MAKLSIEIAKVQRGWPTLKPDNETPAEFEERQAAIQKLFDEHERQREVLEKARQKRGGRMGATVGRF